MEYDVYVPTVQPRLTITFESPSEARDLLTELRIWTPRGSGWSQLAMDLFKALEDCAGK